MTRHETTIPMRAGGTAMTRCGTTTQVRQGVPR